MFASATIGLTTLGRAGRTAAPISYTYSGALTTRGTLAGAPLGSVGLGKSHVAVKPAYTYSGAPTTRGTLGRTRAGLARVAMLSPVAAKARPKKQTGIPLRAGWQPTTAPMNTELRGDWGAPVADDFSVALPWAQGQAVDAPTSAAWADTHTADAARLARWAGQRSGSVSHIPARRVYSRIGLARVGVAPLCASPAATVRTEIRSALDTSERSIWIASKKKDSASRLVWGVFSKTAHSSARAPWLVSHTADSSRRLVWSLYSNKADASNRGLFGSSRRADQSRRFVSGARRPLQAGWGAVIEPGGPTTDHNGTIIIPARRIYLVTNQAIITRIADGVPLEALSASVAIDANSWGWTFNATLSGRMWQEVQPGGTRGDPVTLQININGYPVSVIVESVTRGRSFGKTTVQISGRGIAAELATPFAPVQSFAQTADRTAQQLMGDALTNLGWTVDWQVTDWLVPNGTWGKSGSPMDSITGIAGAIRGMVQADPSLKTLHILPRYKAAPWNWATTNPDVQLPLDPIFVDSLEQDDKPDYNRVFVTGTTGAGRIGQITRDGTAGNLIAPTESDPLITAVEASQQRGLAILGAAGKGWKIGITAPVSDTIPLLQVGQLVQIDPTGENRFGLVRGINLSADNGSGLKVRQQATLEVKQ